MHNTKSKATEAKEAASPFEAIDGRTSGFNDGRGGEVDVAAFRSLPCAALARDISK